MRITKRSVSVWPGYGAAVSSLVLSLLLASIVLSMLAQIGASLESSNQTLLENAFKKFNYPDSVPELPISVPEPAKPKDIKLQPGVLVNAKAPVQVAHLETPQTAVPREQLCLVFSSKLAGVPESQQDEVIRVLTSIAAPADARWRIWAAVQEGDERSKRTTLELIGSIRSLMSKKGLKQSTIEMRLLTQNLPPANVAPGEVVIYVAPIPESGIVGSRS